MDCLAVKVRTQEVSKWCEWITTLEMKGLEEQVGDPTLYVWIIGLGSQFIVESATKTTWCRQSVGFSTKLLVFLSGVSKVTKTAKKVRNGFI